MFCIAWNGSTGKASDLAKRTKLGRSRTEGFKSTNLPAKTIITFILIVSAVPHAAALCLEPTVHDLHCQHFCCQALTETAVDMVMHHLDLPSSVSLWPQLLGV